MMMHERVCKGANVPEMVSGEKFWAYSNNILFVIRNLKTPDDPLSVIVM